MKLPVAFEEKMKRLLKDEYEAYLASYKLPKYQGLRVNTLKLSLEEWEKINPFTSLKTVPWCKEGFYYDAHEKPGKHPYYFAGLYYIQEPSAMSPGAYLPIEPGDRVLDMCAAPGGKTTDIAASLREKLGDNFVLVANEVMKQRAGVLASNVALWGDPNVVVTSDDPSAFAPLEGFFDIIVARTDGPLSSDMRAFIISTGIPAPFLALFFTSMISARIATAISSGVSAPISRPIGVWTDSITS